jgi:hypothetical protein
MRMGGNTTGEDFRPTGAGRKENLVTDNFLLASLQVRGIFLI